MVGFLGPVLAVGGRAVAREGDAMKLQTVRDRAREREPLHGVDAEALEGALALTERERDEALAKYQLILDRAAAGRGATNDMFDRYREVASRLEGALVLTERERDEALAKYQFMVERAADEKLDGYRELASRLAAMAADRDEARRSALDFERALHGSRAMYHRLERRIGDLLRIDAGSGDDD